MRRALIGAAAFVSAAGPVSAHHSFAMFDQSKQVMLVGTVREFQFTNPHAFIELDVPGPGGGAPVDWSIELNSPNNLRRQGWSRDTLKPEDRITAYIAPVKDGKKGGLFVYCTLANGKVLGEPRNGPINAPGLQ